MARSLPDSSQFFVYRRKDTGRYVLRYRESAGKWRDHRIPHEFSRTKRDAARYAVEWLRQLRTIANGTSGPVELPADRGPTIAELQDQWLALRAKDAELSDATREADEGNLKRHIVPAIGTVPLQDLSVRELRAFFRALKAKRSASTVRNVAITLSVLIRDAMAEEWVDLPANPMRHEGVVRELPRKRPRPEREGLVVHLALEQAERLSSCERVPELRRVRYLLSFTTGLRAGESAALAWDDMALDTAVEATVRITRSVRNGRMGPTKTRSSVRTIPLHSQAARALRAWKADGWVKLMGYRPRPTDPVFPGLAEASSRHDARTIRQDLVLAECPTKYAGVDIDFHATRRSFATWLDANGVPEPTIKRILGHAPVGVTQRHYTAGDMKAMRRAIDTIRLNLQTGDVVSLPLAAVGGGGDDGGGDDGGTPDDQGNRDGHIAKLVANRDMPATLQNQNRPTSQGNRPIQEGGGAGNRIRAGAPPSRVTRYPLIALRSRKQGSSRLLTVVVQEPKSVETTGRVVNVVRQSLLCCRLTG